MHQQNPNLNHHTDTFEVDNQLVLFSVHTENEQDSDYGTNPNPIPHLACQNYDRKDRCDRHYSIYRKM